MNTHVFRLHRGDDLLLSIRGYACEYHLSAAVALSCVGCVSRATVRDAGGVRLRCLDEPLEILSVHGTVSAERVHLHIALSREDLSVIGGHLVEGCIVNTTAEVVLLELEGLRFGSVYDPRTGYSELSIEGTSSAPEGAGQP